MTREEAQTVIMTEQKCVDRASTDRCNRDCGNCDLLMDDKVINDAYNMAIKALEQPEPCEDAVSRHMLLNDLEELTTAWEKYPVMAEQIKGVETAIGYVKTIPSVTLKEQRWTPCSETVDIPDHEILACDKYGEEMFGYLVYEDEQWLCESYGGVMCDPIAWREKPEPYRGEGDRK